MPDAKWANITPTARSALGRDIAGMEADIALMGVLSNSLSNLFSLGNFFHTIYIFDYVIM
jgi:hypothetical protein